MRARTGESWQIGNCRNENDASGDERDRSGVRKMDGEEMTVGVGGIVEAAYNAYFEDVYKFVFRRVGNKQIAEDIAHDVFCAALNKIEEFRSHPEPRGWLIKTAKYKLRELNRRMEYRASDSLEEVPEPAVKVHEFEGTELELTALAIIDGKEWELIKDYYLAGITIRELAEKYGITENNMRVRLCRLKAKMRKKIDR